MIFLDQFNSTLLDSAWVGMAQLGSAWLSLFKLILTQLNSAQPGLTRLSIAIGSILALKLKRLPFCSNTFEFSFQDRVGHSGSGFPGGPRTPVSDFQPPYFPPPFGGQQPTAQEVFAAAQAPHLAAAAAATADPYTNSALHNFQTSQVSN